MVVSSYGDVVEIRIRQRHGKGILFVLKIREKENGNFCYPNLGTVLLRYNGAGEKWSCCLVTLLYLEPKPSSKSKR